jgi:hypothetical protein
VQLAPWGTLVIAIAPALLPLKLTVVSDIGGQQQHLLRKGMLYAETQEEGGDQQPEKHQWMGHFSSRSVWLVHEARKRVSVLEGNQYRLFVSICIITRA